MQLFGGRPRAEFCSKLSAGRPGALVRAHERESARVRLECEQTRAAKSMAPELIVDGQPAGRFPFGFQLASEPVNGSAPAGRLEEKEETAGASTSYRYVTWSAVRSFQKICI